MIRFTKRVHYDAQAYMKAMIWEYKFIFRDKAVLFSFVGVSLVSHFYTPIFIPTKRSRNFLLPW